MHMSHDLSHDHSPPCLQLYQLCGGCCLLDPQFVQFCCEFYVTQSVWITRQLDSCRQVYSMRVEHACSIIVWCIHCTYSSSVGRIYSVYYQTSLLIADRFLAFLYKKE